MKRIYACLISVVALSLYSAPVAADQIDGNWCRGNATLNINGPVIVTPGGTRMTGTYDRHGFEYVVPKDEPDAGATIIMAQQHDDLMHLRSSTNPAEIQNWTRCTGQVS